MSDRVTSGRLDWLQALRGLAALAVVLVHCRHYFRAADPSMTVDYWFYPLAAGVDLFFVISGFIMVYTTNHLRGGWPDTFGFWWRRLLRIWPAYLAMTLIFAVYYVVLRGNITAEAILAIARSAFFIPNNPDEFFPAQTVPTGWSLNYEILFYFYFGLLLLVPNSIRLWAAGVGAALLLIVVPYAFGWHASAQPMAAFKQEAYPQATYLRLALNPIIWEFVFGMVAAKVYLSPLRIDSRLVRWSLVAATIVAVLVNVIATHHYLNLRMGAGFAVLLAVLSVSSKSEPISLTPRPLIRLGDVSYTLYLIHLLVIDMVWAAMGPRTAVGYPQAALALLIAASGSIAVSLWLAPIVERRLALGIEHVTRRLASQWNARHLDRAARSQRRQMPRNS